MSNIRISTNELDEKITNICSSISEMDEILEKIDSKLKFLANSNSVYYSTATILLYDHYCEHIREIKYLQESYQNFFQSSKEIVKKYEDLEEEIIKRVDDISSIRIL